MSENDVVIRAEGLGKKYLIGHQAAPEGYASLRDTIAQTARGFLRSASDMARGRQIVAGDEVEEFWALKDVSFEIRRGEVVGVIGRNGAGKSTLLKVLSRITEPTEGRVTIRGRVASLLEVGTGFHPELSGRENIFLNGAILGMSRAEIRRKFDEIVDFAGVEKFLDTPVKRYSSGMYVRLAFSVAAHLEPEILIVDEVLAVGDAEFQKKCLGKMGEVAGHGRTVIFVSHNSNAIRQLCEKAAFLDSGNLKFIGETDASLRRYSQSTRIKKFGKHSIDHNAISLSIKLDYHKETNELEILLTAYTKKQFSIKDMHIFIQSSLGSRAALIDFRAIAKNLGSKIASNRKFQILGRVSMGNICPDRYSLGFHMHTNSFTITEWDVEFIEIPQDINLYPIEYQGPALLKSELSYHYV